MIPTYNQERYIACAVESALAHDYPGLEVIVADDCSTDRTPEIVGTYLGDKRLKLKRNACNLGKHDNYRKLLHEYATGEWAVNLDGDDYFICTDFITAAVREIEKNEKLVCVQAGYIIRSRDGTTDRLVSYGRGGTVDGFDLFLKYPDIAFGHGALLYRRGLACGIDAYRFDVPSEDMETFLRLVLHGEVAFLDRIAYVWRGHAGNISSAVHPAGRIEDINAVVCGAYEYALSLGIDKKILLRWFKRVYAAKARHTLEQLVFHGLEIQVNEAKGVEDFISYLMENRRHVFRDPKFLCAFLSYKALGAAAFQEIYRLYHSVVRRFSAEGRLTRSAQ